MSPFVSGDNTKHMFSVAIIYIYIYIYAFSLFYIYMFYIGFMLYIYCWGPHSLTSGILRCTLRHLVALGIRLPMVWASTFANYAKRRIRSGAQCPLFFLTGL